MRLAGQAKLGYYPTPDLSLSLILTWLATPQPGFRRALDPCCGRGEALAALAAHGHPLETYGIELSDTRAADASETLTHVLNTGYENAVLTDETYSLCLLNPPYDGQEMTGGGMRLEETFLLPTTPLLVPGGVLVYIIPHARINERIARHLAGWYKDMRCFRLTDDDYPVFKQVVIFGVRRAMYKTPTQEEYTSILAWAEGHLPELHAGQGEYALPLSPLKGRQGKPFRFQYHAVSDEAMVREAHLAAASLETNSKDWRDLRPKGEPPALHPVITPKKGHIASQLSGGLLGTNLVQHHGASLLLKGGQRKYSVVVNGGDEEDSQIVIEDKGRKRTMRRVDVEERFETILTTLDETGALRTTVSPQEIAELLKTHVEQLAAVVMARNVPQYEMNPEKWEWEALDLLSRERKLPGRDETGLTDFQRHLTIANGRLLLKARAGILMAEMGSGKTSVAIAIAEYLQTALGQRHASSKRSPYPVLVAGPGIVTGEENWPKEIPDVTPGAEGRVITVGVKPLPKPEKIGRWLESLGLQLDEDAFEGLTTGSCLGKIMLTAKDQGIPLTHPIWRALEGALKRAEKDTPPKRKNAKQPSLLDGRAGGFAWLGLDIPRDANHGRETAGKYSLAQFVDEYQRGLLPEKSFAILSYETAKLGPGRVNAMRTKRVKVWHMDEEGERQAHLAQVCTCPGCGAIVADGYDPESGAPLPGKFVTPVKADNWIAMRRRFCQAPTPRWVWDEETGKKVWMTHDAEGQPYVCGTPLFENTSLRREAAADYVRKKAKDVFGLFLCDEIHMAKAKGTGVGWALTALHTASRYTLGLTGTLFGGYSTSIFWLLYRLVPQVRREFGFSDEMRWAQKFGLLKTTFYVGEDEMVEDGAYTGTRFRETVREKPGLSSAIVGLALERCTFSSLKDIGLPLPDYREEIIRLPLSEAMEDLLPLADGSQDKPPTGLLAWALDRQKLDDGKGAISVWLNTALNWPDAAFRPRHVVFNTRYRDYLTLDMLQKTEFVTDIPALSGWLPKETWLADTCLAERRSGRKVLVYLRQTGEHDIQPRLAECLEAHGLRVGILRPSLAPRQRASWIKAHANQFDVLLTNARLVQVGLNLTTFSTGIFYELDLSLYVTWQGAPRSAIV